MRMWMIGNHVERLLESIGLTKARVEAITGKPCGCDGRKKSLNTLGMKLFVLKVNSFEVVKSSEFWYRFSMCGTHIKEGLRVLIYGDTGRHL